MNSADLGLELKVLEMHFTKGIDVKSIAKTLGVSLKFVNEVVAGFNSIGGKKK